jgi:hypothetical protein
MFTSGEVRFESRACQQLQFRLVDSGFGAAEANYAAIPADLLERIFAVVLETRGGPNMSQTSQPEIGHKSALKQHQNRCRIGR